jgi:hypothetical protein
MPTHPALISQSLPFLSTELLARLFRYSDGAQVDKGTI